VDYHFTSLAHPPIVLFAIETLISASPTLGHNRPLLQRLRAYSIGVDPNGIEEICQKIWLGGTPMAISPQ
jgi:hypothetical protein